MPLHTPLSRRPRLDAETRWLLGLCLARVAFMLPFDTYAATQSLLMQDWHLSASQAGLLHTSFYGGYVLSLCGVGLLADRYGAKRVMLSANVAAAISALLFAVWANDFVSGFVLYGATALCAGGSYTPVLALIAQRVEGTRRGRAFGWYIAATALGYAASLALSSAMIALGGWRGAFYATACGPWVGTLLTVRVLRHTPNRVEPPPHDPATANVWKAVCTNKGALLAVLGYTAHSWELLGMRAWMPTFVATSLALGAGTDIRAASIGASISAVMTATSVFGNISAGSWSDRWGRTTVALLLSGLSVACSFAMGWCVAMPLWGIVSLGVLYSATAFGDSSIYSTALTELVPARYLGTAYALRSVLGFGTGMISPVVFGHMLDILRTGGTHSPALTWGLAFATLGVGGLLAPLSMLWLRRLPDSAQMAGGRR